MIHLPNFYDTKDPETMLRFVTTCSLTEIESTDTIALDANDWINLPNKKLVCRNCLIKMIHDITTTF